MFCFKIS